MDAKEKLIRDFYAARASNDWDAVGDMLATDVAWHESGDEDYSGDYLGREEVLALLRKLVQVTQGTFTLEPTGFLVTADHVATNARWSAQRSGTAVEGNDLAVFRIADGKIAEAWFFPDGFDHAALTGVFSFGASP